MPTCPDGANAGDQEMEGADGKELCSSGTDGVVLGVSEEELDPEG